MVSVSRLAGFLGAAVLSLLVFGDFVEVWHLALIGFVTGFSRAIEQPAEQALLPNTIGQEDLLNGITLSAAAFSGSRVVAPVLGAPLLATVGAGGVLAVAPVFYLIASIQTQRLRVRSTGDVGSMGAFVSDIGKTVHYIVSTAPVFLIFALVVLHCWLTMSFDSLLPEFATQALNGGKLEYNALLVAVGAGSLVATLALATVSRPSLRGSLFLAAGVGSGLFPALMAATGHAASSASAAVGIGASQAVFMALSAVLLQAVVPDGIRGRVMSLYVMLAAGVMSLMNLANGALADQVGTPVLFAIPGLGFAAILIAWSIARADLRQVYRTGALAGASAAA